MNETSTIYVLIIRTNTFFSRFIKKMTGGEYTHASIGLEADCSTLYSFARKYAYLPLPAGFVKESIDRGLMGKSKKAPCVLFCIRVPQEVKLRLMEELEKMFRVRKQYRYSLTGPILCYFNRAVEFKNKFFCSQFAAHALSRAGAIELSKPASLYRPVDFLKQPELEVCYKGTLGELSKLAATVGLPDGLPNGLPNG